MFMLASQSQEKGNEQLKDIINIETYYNQLTQLPLEYREHYISQHILSRTSPQLYDEIKQYIPSSKEVIYHFADDFMNLCDFAYIDEQGEKKCVIVLN